MNLLTSNLQCIDCHCDILIKDYTRQEIYCSNCGLVLVDTSLPVITDNEKAIQEDESKEASNKIKRFLYDMDLMQDTFTWHNALK